MDYLHYRYKSWKPFEYMSMPAGQRKMAAVYMQQYLEERKDIIESLSGN